MNTCKFNIDDNQFLHALNSVLNECGHSHCTNPLFNNLVMPPGLTIKTEDSTSFINNHNNSYSPYISPKLYNILYKLAQHNVNVTPKRKKNTYKQKTKKDKSNKKH